MTIQLTAVRTVGIGLRYNELSKIRGSNVALGLRTPLHASQLKSNTRSQSSSIPINRIIRIPCSLAKSALSV